MMHPAFVPGGNVTEEIVVIIFTLKQLSASVHLILLSIPQ
jgi:hypothetical protein